MFAAITSVANLPRIATSVLTVPVLDLVEQAIDHFRDKVQPVIGSVVYCDLLYGYIEHSGIYIGNNQIVHLSGKGNIEIVSPEKFIASWSLDRQIYVSCRDENPVGTFEVAERAYQQIGKKRDYNIVLNNCHQFSAGCLLGDFENNNKLLTMLKSKTESHLGANTWRIWKR